MQVRVVQKCVQPLEPGGRRKYLSPDRNPEPVEWQGDGELPSCFEPCNPSDFVPVAKARLEAARVRLEQAEALAKASGVEGQYKQLVESRTIRLDEARAALEAARAMTSDGDVVAAAVPPPTVAVHPNLQALPRDSQIQAAEERMDHAADEQWTSQGLPRVEAVSLILSALGFDPAVTRAEIKVARPGFVRET